MIKRQIISTNQPTPDPSQEGNCHRASGLSFPSWEGSGVGSWFRGALKNQRNLPLALHTVATLMILGLLAGCVTDRTAGSWQAFFEKNTDGWRGYRQAGFPTKGWVLENGGLHLLPKSGGGDIVTIKKYTDFEFEWDWRIGPKGNNGVKYLVTEDRQGVPGPEYQMIDDSITPEAHHQTAAFYWVVPPRPDKPLHPPGQWNHSRLLVQGNHVEHWLNGMKVVDYELGSLEILAAVAMSKFKNAPDFGQKITGHLMITDHTEETWLRNIRLRELRVKP